MFGRPKLPKIPEDPKAKNKIIYAVVVVLLAVVALISGRLHMEYKPASGGKQADAPFQVHVLDIGQGDSILVIADGHAMLVDGGEPAAAPRILRYLQEKGISKLDYVAATHAHADHIGGLAEVIKAYPPKNIIEPVCAGELLPVTSTYEAYLDAAEGSGARFRALRSGDRFKVGGARITVLAPDTDTAQDLNNLSLVLRVQYGDCTCLLTGDMEMPEEEQILAHKYDLHADFLKVGHHGSESSCSEAFLAAVRPDYAAISCGKDNDYGHPHKETLNRLHAYTDKVYVTAKQGDIVFRYDPATGKRSIATDKTTS
ncbi:MAG: MBL fold metallo-hydrolase [Oscillospiraceae bacterium]|nr:MBL fold metallo-hydrolase [Oscillospiraceae bacterium]